MIGAALGPDSVPRKAIERAGALELIACSEPVAAEIREVLARQKFARWLTADRQAEISDLPFTGAHWFVPGIRVTDCRDPSDDIYLELVLAANAGLLVSSDSDLLVLDPWRGVRIVTPAAFLRLRLT